MLAKNEIKSCPKCKIPIIRSAGCNYMNCKTGIGGCGHEFCYKCLADCPKHKFLCKCGTWGWLMFNLGSENGDL